MQPDPVQAPIRRRKLYEEVVAAHRGDDPRRAASRRRPAAVRARDHGGARRRPLGGARGDAVAAEDGPGDAAERRARAGHARRPRRCWCRSCRARRASCWRRRAACAQFQEARTLFEVGPGAPRRAARDRRRRRTAAGGARGATARAIGDHEPSCAPTSRSTSSSRRSRGTRSSPSLHDAVVEWLTEQRETSGRAPTAFDDAYRAHERIFDAIAARDPARRRRRCRTTSTRCRAITGRSATQRLTRADRRSRRKHRWLSIPAARPNGASRPTTLRDDGRARSSAPAG